MQKKVLASEAAAGSSLPCPACDTVISVPEIPVAIRVASRPAGPPRLPNPADAHTGGEVSVWVWRGLGIGAFLLMCVIIAFLGAALNPDEPGLGASRMARRVGAPLALVLIVAVQLILWFRKSRMPGRDQGSRRA